MIQIQLTENYRLHSDKNQYIIAVKRVAQKDGKRHSKGEVYWREEKFFSRIDALLRYLPEFLARQEPHTELGALIKSIKSWRDMISHEIQRV